MKVQRFGAVGAILVGLATSIATADDGLQLQYKQQKGERIIYRNKSELKQSQTIMGMTLENTFNTDAVSSATLDGTDEKGNAQVTIKNERLKVKATIGPLGDYSFDSQSSERDMASMIGVYLTPMLERMSTATYQMVIAPDGDVVEVKGYTELLADLLKDNPFAGAAGSHSNEAAKMQYSEVFPKLPKKPLKVGETWEVNADMPMPGIGKVRGRSVYRYVGPDKVGDRATAKIEVNGEATIELDIDQAGSKVTGMLTTTAARGTIQFDVAAGRLLSHESTNSVSGDLNVNAGGMNIPVRHEQNQKVTVDYLEKID